MTACGRAFISLSLFFCSACCLSSSACCLFLGNFWSVAPQVQETKYELLHTSKARLRGAHVRKCLPHRCDACPTALRAGLGCLRVLFLEFLQLSSLCLLVGLALRRHRSTGWEDQSQECNHKALLLCINLLVNSSCFAVWHMIMSGSGAETFIFIRSMAASRSFFRFSRHSSFSCRSWRAMRASEPRKVKSEGARLGAARPSLTYPTRRSQPRPPPGRNI